MNMKYFSMASKLAEKSDCKKQKIGCVVVYKKNKVLSSACNINKTHPIQKKYNNKFLDFDDTPHFMHAEVNALIPVMKEDDIDWSKVSIYLARNIKSRPYGMSRPCPRCMSLLKDLGIHNICYTTDDGYAEERI